MNKWLTLVCMLTLWSSTASASYAENSRRYLSAKDMFTLWAQKFPVIIDKDQVEFIPPIAGSGAPPTTKIPGTCWALGYRNSNASGVVQPALGAPAAAAPGSGFVRWWASCLDQILTAQFKVIEQKSTDENLWQKYWALDLLNRFRDKKEPTMPFHKFNELEWKTLTTRQKELQIRFLIEELIGPNAVIADLGFAKGIDDLLAKIRSVVPDDSTMKLNEANKILITAIALREEFITY